MKEVLQVERIPPTKTCYFFRRPTVVHSFWVKRLKHIEARKEAVTETEVRFGWELYLQSLDIVEWLSAEMMCIYGRDPCGWRVRIDL